MKIIGLDSSGMVASAAIAEDGVLLAEYTTDYKKTHSQTLLPMLAELKEMTELDLDTIDAIAVASGPGSFTGLRIGAATAKGLGLALKKPLVEVPTLEGLAYNMWGSSALICPMMDARRQQVYTGLYEFKKNDTDYELITLMPQCAVSVTEIMDKINESGREVILLGDGVPVYGDMLKEGLSVPYAFAGAGRNRQRAANIAALGCIYFSQGKIVSAAEHKPEYIRKGQAGAEKKDFVKLENILIRELKQGDIERVSRIESESFSMPWSAKDFEELLLRDYCIYLVAECDGKVVACAGMTDICNEGNIDNVVVDKDYRGKKIAQKLIAKLIQTGDARGIKAYTLEVRASNAAAIHIYEKAGFISEGVRPRFYEKPTEDALIMWRRHKME